MWKRGPWIALVLVLLAVRAAYADTPTRVILQDYPGPGTVTLLPNGLYEYDYQIANTCCGFGGWVSIPDPETSCLRLWIPLNPTPCGPNDTSECPIQSFPVPCSLFFDNTPSGAITWCFHESGGQQVGTPVFGLIAPDPPVLEQATVYDVLVNAFAIGVDPTTLQVGPFMVQGPMAPTP